MESNAGTGSHKDRIVVRNARQHNLKGIDLELPRRSLVVFTGPSGSGKSSLAFDTIYAEGQRRYVESLSTYAKQFLERMEKPAVDSVEGISPAVAIEQKNPTRTTRSTVGTATEVYDYLRLLWARAGRTHCPVCDRVVRPDTVQSATDRVLTLPEGSRIMVAFPLPKSARAGHGTIVENLRALGFLRVLVAGDVVELDLPGAELAAGLGHDLAAAAEVLVVVDRLVVRPESAERLADSFGTAFHAGEGEAVVVIAPARGEGGVLGTAAVIGAGVAQGEGAGQIAGGARAEKDVPPVASSPGDSAAAPVEGVGGGLLRFTERFRCPDHPEAHFLDPTPRLFSFNNPYGSCPTCTGFGATLEYDEALIVPNPARSLQEGALDLWEKPRYHRERAKLLAFARERGVSVDQPWAELPAEFRAAALHGTRGFKGAIPFLRSRESKRYKQYIRVYLRQYQSAQTCRDCQGQKLRPEALQIRVGGLDIATAAELPITELREWVRRVAEGAAGRGVDTGATDTTALTPQERAIAAPILRELTARLRFLDDVGLGYLSLHRQMRTLSGGEAQRIGLANSLGSSLMDTLYVLDEPTVGLHPRDTDRLLALLEQLRDAGNSVLVVEHDEAAIRRADHLVELGPGSGERGGTVVFQGTPAELLEAETATARHLARRGDERREVPAEQGMELDLAGGTYGDVEDGRLAVGQRRRPAAGPRRPVDGPRLRLEGARLHNLRGADIEIPLGALTVVTGVSGSGKSTLVHDVLYRALERELNSGETSAKQHLGEAVGGYERLLGAGQLDGVVLVDQSPIGKTPRSNPVTYIKAFDQIREIFARQPLAKKRGYKPGHFSFNVKGGRCEACQGDGVVEVEMVFMADVYVPCDICRGARYQPETLEVEYRGLDIRQVLDLTVDEAIRFFLKEDKLGQALWQLQQVGLGYLRLGQAATTLSGGEAQRLKIARELTGAGKRQGRRIYILDEPTTGLSVGEVRQLIRVLQRLLEAGHTVVVIEHNLEVMQAADWIIDMGPEAGEGGGEVVAMGRPEEVALVEGSHTGRYLREALALRESVAAG